MKTEFRVNKEFILQAHKVACSDWKQKLEDKFPDAFENQLEVGKWYLSESDGDTYLFNYQKLDGCYGFFRGEWTYRDWSWNITEGVRPATNKEVEQALIKEAKKRGLVEGVKVIAACETSHKNKPIKSYYYNNQTNSLHGNLEGMGGAVLFKNGLWAEPIENTTLKRIQEIEAELKELKSKL